MILAGFILLKDIKAIKAEMANIAITAITLIVNNSGLVAITIKEKASLPVIVSNVLISNLSANGSVIIEAITETIDLSVGRFRIGIPEG